MIVAYGPGKLVPACSVNVTRSTFNPEFASYPESGVPIVSPAPNRSPDIARSVPAPSVALRLMPPSVGTMNPAGITSCSVTP